MGNSGGNSKDRMLIEMWRVKTVFMKFQMGRRTLLGIRVEAIHATLWQRAYVYFVHALKLSMRLNLKVTD
jgi:hypothetical protein